MYIAQLLRRFLVKNIINWPTSTKPLFVGEVNKYKMQRINDLIDSNRIVDIKVSLIFTQVRV